MNKSFYILGESGFIGGRCAEYLKSKGNKVFTERVDITDFQALKNAFSLTRPDVVINCAGVRMEPNIDWCETHKEETVKVNVVGALNAMLAAIEAKAYPIQIASGCVYSGGPEIAYSEKDEPNFFGSFYSRMRIAMQFVLKDLPVLQARIRMPLSATPHPRNLINKIISYKKVIDVANSATLLEDLFPALEKISEIKPLGILNLTNEGHITHKNILEIYKEVVLPSHTYEIVSMNEFERTLVKAKRSNCVLSIEKAKSLGIQMRPLNEERLRDIMRTYKKEVRSMKYE